MKTLLDQLDEGILIIDQSLNIKYANEFSKKYLEGPEGKTISDVLHVKNISVLTENLVNSTPLEFESEFFVNNERKIFKIKVNSPIIIFRDITEIRNLGEAKMDFVNSLVHEFSSPMTVMNGYLDLLIDRKDVPEKYNDILKRVHKSTRRLSKLVEELATLSNLELQNYKPVMENINLRSLVIEITEELENKAKRKNIEIEVSIPADFYIKTDSLLLYRILSNLISNAIKYSFDNEVVHVKIKRKEDKTNIIVKDFGIGIKPEELNRIFERFYRASNAKFFKTSGMGLGLSLVKHAVSLLNAKIEVNSSYMLGTEFILTI